MKPFFGRLDPPIITRMCKKKLHNHCVYVIAWYISVAVRKTDVHSYNTSASRPSLKWHASRLGPPNFRCPGAAPGKGIDLIFSENVPSLDLGKVRKFQHRSSSRFRDISEKPDWWMKTPLPLIGLMCAITYVLFLVTKNYLKKRSFLNLTHSFFFFFKILKIRDFSSACGHAYQFYASSGKEIGWSLTLLRVGSERLDSGRGPFRVPFRYQKLHIGTTKGKRHW